MNKKVIIGIIILVSIAGMAIMIAINWNTNGIEKPEIALIRSAIPEDREHVFIESASKHYELSYFKAVLYANNTESGTLEQLINGANDGELTFIDYDQDGYLTSSDTFVISGTYSTQYELVLIWRQSGDILDSMSWIF
jgi:signal transduction histidine kinase